MLYRGIIRAGKKWLDGFWPRKELTEFQDLEGWRVYYIGIMLFIALIILPIGLVFSLPTYIAQQKYWLIALEIVIIFFMAIILRARYTPPSVKIFFTLLYGLMLAFIITLGPFYARPGWLVMCVVSAAFLFGVRAAIITTAINAVLLMLLYGQVGPHLPAWAPVYQEPFATWIMFVMSISLVSLFASLPVGLLLNQMNKRLIHEHDLRTQLASESEALQSRNTELRNEISKRQKAEEEKKRLRAELDQARKMEAVGTLAGGIAHDFNNILSAIIGYSELALNDTAVSEKTRQKITEVLASGERAKALVNQILAFSRKAEIRIAPLELKEAISESLKMMRSLIPANIKIEQNYADSGLVLSSSTYIHQIIMNLCSNAVNAMENDGGVLAVRLKREYVGEAGELHLPAGSYLKMTISDTGQGMKPEVAARVFEPYFTTKEIGRGTGLGLSVVHGVVKSHGGAIKCHSTPETGTSFDIYFPEIEDRRKSEDDRQEEVMPTGTETILYVDDEPMLCEIAIEMLESLGYQVVGKTSSLEAHELFAANPQRFAAVITDMSMPQLTGDKLAQKMIALRPDTPIIVCTGYSAHISGEDAARLGIREFLMKPYKMPQLAHAVRRVIDDNRFAEKH